MTIKKEESTQNLHTNFIAAVLRIAKKKLQEAKFPPTNKLNSTFTAHNEILQWEGASQVQVTTGICVYKSTERNTAIVSEVKFS